MVFSVFQSFILDRILVTYLVWRLTFDFGCLCIYVCISFGDKKKHVERCCYAAVYGRRTYGRWEHAMHFVQKWQMQMRRNGKRRLQASVESWLSPKSSDRKCLSSSDSMSWEHFCLYKKHRLLLVIWCSTVIVWHSGNGKSSNGVGCLSELTQRQTWLLLGLVNIFVWANHLGMLPLTQTNSTSCPQRDMKWVPARMRWCSATVLSKRIQACANLVQSVLYDYFFQQCWLGTTSNTPPAQNTTWMIFRHADRLDH